MTHRKGISKRDLCREAQLLGHAIEALERYRRFCRIHVAAKRWRKLNPPASRRIVEDMAVVGAFSGIDF